MNQLRDAVAMPDESRMSPRKARMNNRNPQYEQKPNGMNPTHKASCALLLMA